MANFRYIDPDENTRDPFAVVDKQDTDFEKLLDTEGPQINTKRYRMGEQVTGTVIRIGQDFVFIDLGGKNTGALSIDEFVAPDAIKPILGEPFQAYVRSDNGSEIILTRTLRRSEMDDGLLRLAHESMLPVEAKIEKVTKGGFEASVGGKRAFVPLSQMEVGRIESPEAYIGAVLKFHITEYKQGGRNIVLSRRTLLREENESKSQELLRNIEVGQTLRATITRFATFGAFADLGGVEGLIPMSELAWKRVKSAEDVVKAGEVVHVKVLKIERVPKLRIGLSLKDAGEDPWMSMATRLTPGEQIQGRITRLSEFGAFVEVIGGIEGLIHISQLTWDKKVGHPREVVKEDQEVSIHILSVDLEGHKLSLSLKGPMPEAMAEKIRSRQKGGHGETITPEERELMAEWEQYKKTAPALAQPGKREESSILAAAFSKANTPAKRAK